MGKKNRRQFATEVCELALKRGIRIGLLVFEDQDAAFGFTTYKNKGEAEGGLTVLMNMLSDIANGDEDE